MSLWSFFGHFLVIFWSFVYNFGYNFGYNCSFFYDCDII